MNLPLTPAFPDTRVRHALAQVLVGIDADAFDNGVSEPWKGIGARLAALPLPDRRAALQREVADIPGMNWDELVSQILALDPTRECTDDREHGDADPATLPPAVPFPVTVLPSAFRDLVVEGAQAIGCPPEYIAVPLLASAGAAIGTAVRLQIKPQWYEWPLLYTAIVGPSGTKKTPAKNLATRFTMDQGLEHSASHQQNLEDFDGLMAEYQRAVDEHRKTKNKSSLLPLPEKPTRPILKRAWIADATIEALSLRLQQNPRGLVLIRDELASLSFSLNQYRGGRGADLQFFLSVWSCDPVTIDRKHEVDPTVLHQPFLAIVGGIQPGLLPKVFGRDRLFDGFTPRFLFADPEVLPQRSSEFVVSQETIEQVQRVYAALYKIVHRNPYALVPQPHLVRLSDEGRKVFAAWEDMINVRLDKLSEDDPFRAPLAKMPGQLARLALILHVSRWAAGEFDDLGQLDGVTMQAAIRLADYFVAHARRVWQRLMESQEDSKMRQVVNWLRRIKRPVTQREVLRAGVAGLRSAAEAGAMLNRMVDCGLVEPVETGRTARFALKQTEKR